MVLATRPISWRTEPSRSGVPILPWKYLLATMLVAVCDQVLGTSTSSWRKMVTPFSFPISAVRFSHSTESKGDFLPSVKYLGKVRPRPVRAVVLAAATSVAGEFPLNACFTVAIRSSALPGFLPSAGNPTILLLCPQQEAPRFAPVRVGARATRFVECVKSTREKKTTAKQSY